eukprot:TRINITY_DN7777_c0_g1_i1.p1 TRINITY_DN7777_c0_g1~~TRINITY_DN7777_c0_g1_i1.p1  ORF type:complete len:369 (-),score=66.17 TRINITY_DN7777_c0_g1_i1:121-1227(-)
MRTLQYITKKVIPANSVLHQSGQPSASNTKAKATNDVRISFPDDDPQSRRYYIGGVRGNKPHGTGVLTWNSGNYVRFEGEFVNGEMKKGCLYFGPEGKSVYSGTIADRKADGWGVVVPDPEHDSLLERYEGKWSKGLKHGKGMGIFRNGDSFNGDWENNKIHGRGTLVWSNGTMYAGNFVDDEIDGKGVIMWANKRQLTLQFEQKFPHSCRVSARVVSYSLLALSLFFVLPHLVSLISTYVGSFFGFSEEDACAMVQIEEGLSKLTNFFVDYAGTHFRSQLHYFRVGMLALLIISGDIEDIICSVVWFVISKTCSLGNDEKTFGIKISTEKLRLIGHIIGLLLVIGILLCSVILVPELSGWLIQKRHT